MTTATSAPAACLRTFVSASWITRTAASPTWPLEAALVTAQRELDRTLVLLDQRRDRSRRRHRRIAAQCSDRTARLLQPLARELVCALDALADRVRIRALREQRVGRLELDHEAGERVREHVVDVARDPRRLFESRGSQLLLVRALRLRQQQLGLLEPQA